MLDKQWEDNDESAPPTDAVLTHLATAIMLCCIVGWAAWALLEKRGGQNLALYVCASIFSICTAGYLASKKFYRAATLLAIFFTSRLLLSLAGSPDRFVAGIIATGLCILAYCIAMIYFDRKKNTRELLMMPAFIAVSIMCLIVG